MPEVGAQDTDAVATPEESAQDMISGKRRRQAKDVGTDAEKGSVALASKLDHLEKLHQLQPASTGAAVLAPKMDQPQPGRVPPRYS